MEIYDLLLSHPSDWCLERKLQHLRTSLEPSKTHSCWKCLDRIWHHQLDIDNWIKVMTKELQFKVSEKIKHHFYIAWSSAPLSLLMLMLIESLDKERRVGCVEHCGPILGHCAARDHELLCGHCGKTLGQQDLRLQMGFIFRINITLPFLLFKLQTIPLNG